MAAAVVPVNITILLLFLSDCFIYRDFMLRVSDDMTKCAGALMLFFVSFNLLYYDELIHSLIFIVVF